MYIGRMPGTSTLNTGLCIQFWSHFSTAFVSRFDLGWKILINFRYFLAHDFAAHISGWVRVKDGAIARLFFELGLVKWGSGGKMSENVS